MSEVQSNLANVQSFNTHTEAALARLETVQTKIHNTSQRIESILAEIQALEPPAHPGKDASEEELNRYQQAVQRFEAKLQSLNDKATRAQRELGQLMNEAQQIQSLDIPQGRREDAKAAEEHAKREQERLEAGMRAIAGASRGNDGVDDDRKRLALKVEVRQETLAAADVKDVKTAVRIAALLIDQLGGPERAVRRAGEIPTAAGSGLPPIEMP